MRLVSGTGRYGRPALRCPIIGSSGAIPVLHRRRLSMHRHSHVGTVVANFGHNLLVEDSKTRFVHRCEPLLPPSPTQQQRQQQQQRSGRRTHLMMDGCSPDRAPTSKLYRPVAVGDHVSYKPCTVGNGTVTKILPRCNEFARRSPKSVRNRVNGVRSVRLGGFDRHDGAAGYFNRVVAVNIGHVFIIVSPEPVTDYGSLNHYLVTSQLQGIPVTIVNNKADLQHSSSMTPLLCDFEVLGYPVVHASAVSDDGVVDLRNRMIEASSTEHAKRGLESAPLPLLFLGISGVGKSSLLGRLMPDVDLWVSDLQTKTRRGRHTTSATVQYRLPHPHDHIAVLDTPGIGQFCLRADVPREKLAIGGFPEMTELRHMCALGLKCLHLNEQDCAIRAAAVAQEMDEMRQGSDVAAGPRLDKWWNSKKRDLVKEERVLLRGQPDDALAMIACEDEAEVIRARDMQRAFDAPLQPAPRISPRRYASYVSMMRELISVHDATHGAGRVVTSAPKRRRNASAPPTEWVVR